ncbi:MULTISPECIES: hypothetical protein [Streptomyces]|uniref:hypothetical protein n=1 Tax=Streptomyces TaxID=1883 RepID=UPI001C8CC5FD|nr:hypothetical protein [Streptomyces lateritius]MBX9424800.1 hypothetical protein [Streptomyces lateritius]
MRPLTPHDEDRRSPVEDRLRAAFAARAALVTYRDLRRDAPPRGRAWGARRVRGVVLAGLGAAVAVAAAYLLVLAPGGPVTPAPVPPARSPGVGVPTTPPTPRPAAPPTPSVAGSGAPGPLGPP